MSKPYRVKDRLAVAQLKYQVRRFLKQCRQCAVSPAEMEKLEAAAATFFEVASGVVQQEDQQ